MKGGVCGKMNDENMKKAVALDELPADDKKLYLFNKQKELLDTFLQHHTITQAQYNKSLHDLKLKMGIEPIQKEKESK